MSSVTNKYNLNQLVMYEDDIFIVKGICMGALYPEYTLLDFLRMKNKHGVHEVDIDEPEMDLDEYLQTRINELMENSGYHVSVLRLCNEEEDDEW